MMRKRGNVDVHRTLQQSGRHGTGFVRHKGLDGEQSGVVLRVPGLLLPKNFKFVNRHEPRPIFFRGPKSAQERPSSGPALPKNVKDSLQKLCFAHTQLEAQIAEEQHVQSNAWCEVVDHDANEQFEDYVSEDLLGHLLLSGAFRGFILIVILTVSLMVGLQTSDALNRKAQAAFDVMDKIFLTVFAVEIGLKWMHGFVQFWRVGWNVFDFTLVFISFLGEILGSQLSFLSSGRIFRIFRVLRAFRTLRSVTAMKALQGIVECIVDSIPDMANVLLLILIVMFVFAVTGVDLLGGGNPTNFGTMPDTIYTLFICTTQDGWQTIFWSTADAGLFFAAAPYFVLFITIVPWGFVQVLVGILITNLQVSFDTMNAESTPFRSLEATKKPADNSNAEGDSSHGTEDFSEVGNKVWGQQHAVRMPEFATMSPAALEDYFLVLLAIEDNLAEYKRIKFKLHKVLRSVQDENGDAEEDSESDDWSDTDVESEPDEDAPVTDAMTLLIKREEKQERRERHERDRQQRSGPVGNNALLNMSSSDEDLHALEGPGPGPLPLPNLSTLEEDKPSSLPLAITNQLRKLKGRASTLPPALDLGVGDVKGTTPHDTSGVLEDEKWESVGSSTQRTQGVSKTLMVQNRPRSLQVLSADDPHPPVAGDGDGDTEVEWRRPTSKAGGAHIVQARPQSSGALNTNIASGAQAPMQTWFTTRSALRSPMNMNTSPNPNPSNTDDISNSLMDERDTVGLL